MRWGLLGPFPQRGKSWKVYHAAGHVPGSVACDGAQYRVYRDGMRRSVLPPFATLEEAA